MHITGWRTLREFSDFRDFCFHFKENYAGFSSECLTLSLPKLCAEVAFVRLEKEEQSHWFV
jgi:hypothetical protein